MPNEHIAVVNHEPAFLRLMEVFLESQGYKAVTLHNSSAAFEVFCKQPPDLIVLDIWLERQDEGWNLIQLLRMEPLTKGIPIIVCSTDSQSLGAKSALLQTLNCEALEKPFDLDILQQKIERGLAVRKNIEPAAK